MKFETLIGILFVICFFSVSAIVTFIYLDGFPYYSFESNIMFGILLGVFYSCSIIYSIVVWYLR